MPHLPAPGRPVPVSTYRVQLRPPAADHPGFGFDAAADLVPYLADLGVTHLYCSPCLQAAPGSAHGYDVVDHTTLNRELGGQPGRCVTRLPEGGRRKDEDACHGVIMAGGSPASACSPSTPGRAWLEFPA